MASSTNFVVNGFCLAQNRSLFPVVSFPMRRFPTPWTVEAIHAGFKVVDANGQALAYVYGYAGGRAAAKELTLDEARRVGANIAKLPKLLGNGS